MDKFRQRGHRPRFSDKTYRITKILDDAVPIGYRLSEHGKRLFYKEELAPSVDSAILNQSVTTKKLLGIISSKLFKVETGKKWLATDKAAQNYQQICSFIITAQ